MGTGTEKTLMMPEDSMPAQRPPKPAIAHRKGASTGLESCGRLHFLPDGRPFPQILTVKPHVTVWEGGRVTLLSTA